MVCEFYNDSKDQVDATLKALEARPTTKAKSFDPRRARQAAPTAASAARTKPPES